MPYSFDWFKEIFIVHVIIDSYKRYPAYYKVRLHRQTPTLMHMCQAERQFVSFLWWSLVWPSRGANPQAAVWKVVTLTTKPSWVRKLRHTTFNVSSFTYRIRPNYRPCPHNRPLTFYFIFTYYRTLDDLFPDFLLYFHFLSHTWQSFGTSGREQIYVSAPGAY